MAAERRTASDNKAENVHVTKCSDTQSPQGGSVIPPVTLICPWKSKVEGSNNKKKPAGPVNSFDTILLKSDK